MKSKITLLIMHLSVMQNLVTGKTMFNKRDGASPFYINANDISTQHAGTHCLLSRGNKDETTY